MTNGDMWQALEEDLQKQLAHELRCPYCGSWATRPIKDNLWECEDCESVFLQEE